MDAIRDNNLFFNKIENICSTTYSKKTFNISEARLRKYKNIFIENYSQQPEIQSTDDDITYYNNNDQSTQSIEGEMDDYCSNNQNNYIIQVIVSEKFRDKKDMECSASAIGDVEKQVNMAEGDAERQGNVADLFSELINNIQQKVKELKFLIFTCLEVDFDLVGSLLILNYCFSPIAINPSNSTHLRNDPKDRPITMKVIQLLCDSFRSKADKKFSTRRPAPKNLTNENGYCLFELCRPSGGGGQQREQSSWGFGYWGSECSSCTKGFPVTARSREKETRIKVTEHPF